MRLAVGVKVLQYQIRIGHRTVSVQQTVVNRPEQVAVRRIKPVDQLIHDPLQSRVCFGDFPWTIAAALVNGVDLLGLQAENVHVLQTDCLAHLHISAVERTDR